MREAGGGGGGRRGGGVFFFSAVSLFEVLVSLLARLNCRCFLAGQFFLSGMCVVGRSCLECHALPWG